VNTLYILYYVLYFGTLYVDGISVTSEIFPRANLSFKPGSHRSAIVRAFGACDVYRNLPPRKGFVKIAGTRVSLSRDAHISRDTVEERKKERRKERRGKRDRVECEATMIRPQKIIRGGPRDSLAV